MNQKALNPPRTEEVAILSVGADPVLVARRAALLQSGGFTVHSATDIHDALELLASISPRVVVLGDGLPWKQRKRIVEEVLRLLPRPRLIMLYHASAVEAQAADAVLDVQGDPENLVRTIGYLLSPTARS